MSYYSIGIFLIVRPSLYEILLIRWRSASYDDWNITLYFYYLIKLPLIDSTHPQIQNGSSQHQCVICFSSVFLECSFIFFKNPKLLHHNRLGIHKLQMTDNHSYSRIRELEHGLYSPEPASYSSYLGSICLPIEHEISS
jgi:hypothetical protein